MVAAVVDSFDMMIGWGLGIVLVVDMVVGMNCLLVVGSCRFAADTLTALAVDTTVVGAVAVVGVVGTLAGNLGSPLKQIHVKKIKQLCIGKPNSKLNIYRQSKWRKASTISHKIKKN